MSAIIPKPNFEALPIHEVQEKIHEDKERSLRFANKDNITAHYTFWGSIIKAIEWELNLYIRIYGDRGLGKSESGMSTSVGIWRIAKTLGLKSRIVATFSFEKTLEVLQSLAKELEHTKDSAGRVHSDTVYVILQDEMSYLMGEGSINLMKAIINILNQARVARVFLIIISPRREEFAQISGHADMILEAKRRDNNLRMNQLRLWTKTEWPIGFMYIPLHPYDDLREKYEAMKWKNLLRLMAQGGIAKAQSGEMYMEIAQRFVEYIKKNKLPNNYRALRDAFEAFVIENNIPFMTDNIYKRAQRYAVTRAMAEFPEEKEVKAKDEDFLGREKGQFKFTLVKDVEDNSILSYVYDALIELYESGRIKTRKLKKKHLDLWKMYYIDDITQDQCAELMGITDSSIFRQPYKKSGWLAIVREELLGYAVEIALTKTYLKGFKVVGENNPHMPDLIDGETPKNSKTWVEVKARHRETGPSADFINEAEREFLKRGQGTLYLVIFTLNKKKKEAKRIGTATRLQTYKVEYVPPESPEEEIPEEQEKEIEESKGDENVASQQ